MDPVPPPACPAPAAGCSLAQRPSETYCNPDYLPAGYAKTGAMLQFIDRVPPASCAVAPRASLCTSGNCVMLADGQKTPQVAPLSLANPGLGLTWNISAPPYEGPFNCPNGEGRLVVMRVLCDEGGLLGAGAVVSRVEEAPECTYVVSFPHKRGCGGGATRSASASASPTATPSGTGSRTGTPTGTPRRAGGCGACRAAQRAPRRRPEAEGARGARGIGGAHSHPEPARKGVARGRCA